MIFNMSTVPGVRTNLRPSKNAIQNEKARDKLLTTIVLSYPDLFQDFHPFGTVFFKKQIILKQYIQLFDHKSIQTCQSDQWLIHTSTKEEQQMWDMRFQLIQQVTATELIIKGIPYTNILKTIQSVGFIQLRQLNLYSCGIQNLQAFSILDAPHLKKINLIYNQAVEYKSLKKSNFRLKQFYIYSMSEAQSRNQTQTCVKLTHSQRWNFTLASLRLQKHGYNSIIMNDLSFIAKLKIQPQFGYTTYLSTQKRIDQSQIRGKICNQRKMHFYAFERIIDQDLLRPLVMDEIFEFGPGDLNFD